MSRVEVWSYLNGVKREAVERLPEELWVYVKQECDDLFRQATGGNYSVCPAWWISL
jgi:hypothetical protein